VRRDDFPAVVPTDEPERAQQLARAAADDEVLCVDLLARGQRRHRAVTSASLG
jgi:hypothetical protein